MKDFVNPFVLLLVMVLVGCRMNTEDSELVSSILLWELVICATALLVDAVIALARAATHRSGLVHTVWAVAFLILGSMSFATSSRGESSSGEELAAFLALRDVAQASGDINVRDESGETVLTLAASLGKVRVVRDLLTMKSQIRPEDGRSAAFRAVEGGHVECLKLLLDEGVPVSGLHEGTTLLCCAAQNSCQDIVSLLLARGADINEADIDGVTPLMHGVMAGNLPVVRLLRQSGADSSLRDSQGRDAASYARSDAIKEILTVPLPKS